MLVDDFLQHVPDLRDHRLDHLLRGLDVLDRFALDQLGHDERLEQLERHQLRQAALVQPQARTGDDHRAAGVVNALTEQVLAEAALLALEHVRERLQRPVAGARDRAPATAVVEQGVDGLLQHPLLVVDDDLGGAEVEQPFQPVVAVDHPAVEVVEVGGRETTAVQLHHRPQLRRNHRHRVEDHPVRLVVGVPEGARDFQPLHRAGLFLAFGAVDRLLELLDFGVEVDLLEQVADRFGTHAAAEVLAPAERRAEPVLELTEDRLVVDDVLRLHLREDLPDLLHPLRGLFEVGLGVGDLGVELFAQFFDHFGPVVVLQLAQLRRRQFQRVGPDVVFVVELVLGAVLQVGDPALQGLVQLLGPFLFFGLVGVDDFFDLFLQFPDVFVTGLLVDPGDHRGSEVEDLLELFRSHVDQVADPARDALEEPDVRDRRGEVDVPHPLAADLGAGHLDAAALADDSLVTDPLVLAAVALPVLGRTEDALAEEPVFLGLQRPVVDRLGLRYLAPAPGADFLRRREPDLDRVEIVDVDHQSSTSAGAASSAFPAPSPSVPASPSATTCSSCSSAAPLEESARTPVRSIPSSSAAFSRSSSSSEISTSEPSDTTLASSERLWISFKSTLKDSGIEGSGMFSPLTIASYALTRPTVSSDLTVSISCRV